MLNTVSDKSLQLLKDASLTCWTLCCVMPFIFCQKCPFARILSSGTVLFLSFLSFCLNSWRSPYRVIIHFSVAPSSSHYSALIVSLLSFLFLFSLKTKRVCSVCRSSHPSVSYPFLSVGRFHPSISLPICRRVGLSIRPSVFPSVPWSLLNLRSASTAFSGA